MACARSRCATPSTFGVADGRSLQFEDIATQSLGSAVTHLERLATINKEAVALQGLHRSGGATDNELLSALRLITATACVTSARNGSGRRTSRWRSRTWGAGTVGLF